jgi:hypothetical protein
VRLPTIKMARLTVGPFRGRKAAGLSLSSGPHSFRSELNSPRTLANLDMAKCGVDVPQPDFGSLFL